MKRKEFIKKSIILGAGMCVLPSFSLIPSEENYTRSQLIGKGNPDIVGTSYTSKMHKDAKAALERMRKAAASEQIKIEVVSAFRSFQRQKEIFEGKYNRFTAGGLSPLEAIHKIIEYSTIPGTSRHHWGTDLDLIDGNAPRPSSVLQAEHFHGNGPFCKMKDWLTINAESFGFFEVYTDLPERKGFAYEPWHFSYAPISIPMLQAYQQLNLKTVFKEENIKGNIHFTEDFIDQYRKQHILDINPKLLV